MKGNKLLKGGYLASCRLELPKLTLAGQLQIQRKTENRRTGMFTCPTEDITLRIKVGPYTAIYPVSSRFSREIFIFFFPWGRLINKVSMQS